MRSLALSFATVLLLCSGYANASEDLLQLAKQYFQPLPATMPGSELDTSEKIQLGKRLYFETALSANHSQSCNSCHDLTGLRAGADDLPTSFGALGSRGLRNSPTTWNAGLQFVQFWDGRAATLEEQARSPILNPTEMALSSEQEAMQRLESAGYRPSFETAFGGHDTPFSFANILSALAAFQRTLISEDRFDQFLEGQANALTSQEKQGLEKFIRTGCNACHNGPLLGGNSFMKLGIAIPYPNQSDTGRAQVTGKVGDKFFFKVPPLRNVGLTAPYFHDGASATLEKTIFDTGIHQLGIKLQDKDVADIAAFLRSLDNFKEPLKIQE